MYITMVLSFNVTHIYFLEANMTKWIYSFEEGSVNDKDLLGGKGANLAEMSNLGLPVPPGFTITTESCIKFLENPNFFNSSLKDDILKAVAELEIKTDKSFNGEKSNLLLVSVRSGAKFSMPGMMDTILNLGLNDQRTRILAEQTNPDFAYNCYRRLLQMFADVVYGIPKELFDELVTDYEHRHDKKIKDLTPAEHQDLVKQYKEIYLKENQSFPENPTDQLYAAIQAVFKSWNNNRAKVYRELNHISHDLGTAVNVQAMVFGNSDKNSGTGVCFTRNPANGEAELFGEYLLNAQGEDVVAGIRTPEPIAVLEKAQPQAYKAFKDYAKILENHYKDMQDIEFTIEKGKLYILQTRDGKRTAKASLKIALDLVDQGIISKKEALLRVSPTSISQLIHPVFEGNALEKATFSEIVFTADRAKELHALGRKVILVRQETSPEDIEGMVVSQAIVTSQGGMTSHAAVVARGMGTCCVAGCGELNISEEKRTLSCGNLVLTEGDTISVDGGSGCIYMGEIPTVLVENNQDLQRLLSWADEVAHLKVRANAETVKDLETAMKFGAQGVGLARTEHMFFGQDRILEMRRLILADNDSDINTALKHLLDFQEGDFYQMFKTVQNKPMIVRLLDPPMHEFLPKDSQEIKLLAEKLNKSPEKLARQIENLQESNPMLGHRGCRLGITEPNIYKMQTEAIFRSAIKLHQEGLKVKPEIMIPLIADRKELNYVKSYLTEHIQFLFKEYDLEPFPYEIGTMIELPRACLTADKLAEEADFFSFGTNDLTQMTYGFSRDDIGKFIGHYKNKSILPSDPFQHIDEEGVGELMRIAISKARQVKPNLSIGICGEVGGDPTSISFFQEIDVTYVSCSPYRVPVARLAVAQAVLQRKEN